jgi:hypothetical protein
MLQKLLLRTQHKSRLWAALIALCIGTTLLLLSVTIWWNFNELLYGKNQNDSLGSTYVMIGKRVTEQNMGVKGATIFSQQDIAALQQAPEVQEVGTISSNHFPVYAMMGGQMGFATDMPLESVPDKFLDKLPSDWKWQPGSATLPLIVSSQFLDLYNYVFAPSQGLPQLSESSVKAIALNVKIGRGENSETYLAHVVGFSDRIGSVLAPQSFIDYGNHKYGSALPDAPSQLILKTKDPSDTRFAKFLDEHDYATNAQNLRWSRVRAIVEVVTSATGILALFLMGIGTLVFILFIELTVAKAQQSLTLLLQIGYSPRYLGSFMIRRFLPMVVATIIVAACITIAAQAITAGAVKAQGLALPLIPGWPVWAAMLLSSLLLVWLVTSSIRGAIKK